MTSNGDTYLTQEGLKKLEEELALLKSKRLQIAERIERAKELGDLSENAEYHSAREEQGFTEGRIADIERLIKGAIVVQKNGRSDIVNLGSKIRVCDQSGREKIFEIVGINEADPIFGKISNESPIGQAFMGKRVGESVKIIVPKGTIYYTIVSIE
jgi:transcription elongation factor GreA